MTIAIARRIGSALNVKSETKIRSLNDALLEYVRLTQQSATTTVPGAVDWSQLNNVPATFAPSAHTHAAEDDIDGTGLGDYADDGAAATGGVAVGGLYRNGSVVQVRVS